MGRTRMLAVCVALLFVTAAATAGEGWKHITNEQNPNLPHDEIKLLEKGTDGRIWVGTKAGLAWMKGEKLHPIKELPAPKKKAKKKKDGEQPKEKILKITPWDILDEGEKVYVAHDRGLLLLEGEKKTPLRSGKTSNVFRLNPSTLVAVGSENIYINSGDATDAEAWRRINFGEKQFVVAAHQAQDDSIWVIIDGNGLRIIPTDVTLSDDGTIEKETIHLEGRNIKTLLEDHAGNIWAGLWGDGVQVYDGDTWTRHLDYLETAILSLVDGGEDGVWLRTDAGVAYQYQDGEWHERLDENDVVSFLSATEDRTVWCQARTLGGLSHWTGTEFEVELPTVLPVRAVVKKENGTLVVGGVLDGVHLRKGKK